MLDYQLRSYQQVDTTTADPPRVVVLLFDGALRQLRQCQQALDRGDRARFAYTLSRAHAIVGELAGSLNYEAGGEIAANLGRLYDFILRHLTEGLIAGSRVHVDRVIGLLTELRDAFEQAVKSRTS